MNKLWSASNIKTFGGGVDEDNFLRALEQLIGDYNRPTVSTSISRGAGPASRSTSWQAVPTPIMSVADLRALPPDRAVTFPAGAPPALIQPLYWFQNPDLKAVVEESIATYGTPPPAPTRTPAPSIAGARVFNPWVD